MKKTYIYNLLIFLLIAGGLTACRQMDHLQSPAKTWWVNAQEADTVRDYVEMHMDELDIEVLKDVAGGEKYTAIHQFQALVLLCELEYWMQVKADPNADSMLNHDRRAAYSGDDIYRYSYPISSSYVTRYLSRVKTEEKKFWSSLEKAKSSHNYFMQFFAALNDIDEDTLVQLTLNMPKKYQDTYGDQMRSAVEKWFIERPDQYLESGIILADAGYMEPLSGYELEARFFEGSSDAEGIWADSEDEALDYVQYVKDTVVPTMVQIDKTRYLSDSVITGQESYHTSLFISIDKELQLDNSEAKNPEGFIETEGKKVVAFYQNPYHLEFQHSPSSLRLIGDFSLTLSDAHFPEKIADADYFLVLTPSYEYGDFYKNRLKQTLDIRPVHSITTIELYDAKSRTLIRHLGDIREEAEYIYVDDSKAAAGGDSYPRVAGADLLTYIYENINQPELYANMAALPGNHNVILTTEQSIFMGDWEITYLSWNETVNEVVANRIKYYVTETDDVSIENGLFKITNRSNGEKRFQADGDGSGSSLGIRLIDVATGESYPHSFIGAAEGLNGAAIKAGESKTGLLYFVVPDQFMQGDKTISIEFLLKPQAARFVVEKTED